MLVTLVALSGLKINLDKSDLIPIARLDHVEELVSELGCKEGKLPATYLGLPLGAPFKAMAARVEKTLSKRQRQFIYLFLWGWGVTLIKSTLSSLTICFLFLFNILRKVKLRLEKIQRDFFRGGGALGKKIHVVK